jgi:DNA-binding transcriptional LysR family regulator
VFAGDESLHYDLADLRLFAAIAEEASSTRGAARAHLARPLPAIAWPAWKKPRRPFERHARGLRPTRAGEALLGHARQVFAQLEQMHADLSPFARGVRAQVSLYANTNAINCFLPDDLGDFLRAEPHPRTSRR